MKRVCVYCGSSPGKRPAYVAAARDLGRELVRREIGLVYGGASIGVMGAVADAVLAQGGEAIGVIPQALADKEVAHCELTELRVVTSMHQRKALMADLADGFIALPGGLGTFEELFEILTWSQLGLHSNPCGILNVEGYFDHLTQFLNHAVEEEFVTDFHRDMLLTEQDPAKLLDAMSCYRPPKGEKWIGRNET